MNENEDITNSYEVITKGYRREREKWNNRFRLIRNRMKRSRFGSRRNASGD